VVPRRQPTTGRVPPRTGSGTGAPRWARRQPGHPSVGRCRLRRRRMWALRSPPRISGWMCAGWVATLGEGRWGMTALPVHPAERSSGLGALSAAKRGAPHASVGVAPARSVLFVELSVPPHRHQLGDQPPVDVSMCQAGDRRRPRPGTSTRLHDGPASAPDCRAGARLRYLASPRTSGTMRTKPSRTSSTYCSGTDGLPHFRDSAVPPGADRGHGRPPGTRPPSSGRAGHRPDDGNRRCVIVRGVGRRTG
jgi:hypothetical protein